MIRPVLRPPLETEDPFLEWSIQLDLKLFGRETPFSRIKLQDEAVHSNRTRSLPRFKV